MWQFVVHVDGGNVGRSRDRAMTDKKTNLEVSNLEFNIITDIHVVLIQLEAKNSA